MMKPDRKTHIANLTDLKAEIILVKKELQNKEADLGKRAGRIPAEAAKAAIGAVVPMIIGGELASGAWKLARGAFGMMKGKDKEAGQEQEGAWKETLMGGAKQLGFFGALKLLLSLWKGK